MSKSLYTTKEYKKLVRLLKEICEELGGIFKPEETLSEDELFRARCVIDKEFSKTGGKTQEFLFYIDKELERINITHYVEIPLLMPAFPAEKIKISRVSKLYDDKQKLKEILKSMM